MKYRKKPVVIEAVQVTEDCADEAVGWNDTFVFNQDERGRNDPGNAEVILWVDDNNKVIDGEVGTLEGPLHISLNDWLITGVQGEKYPCKPDIFAATYEVAE